MHIPNVALCSSLEVVAGMNAAGGTGKWKQVAPKYARFYRSSCRYVYTVPHSEQGVYAAAWAKRNPTG